MSRSAGHRAFRFRNAKLSGLSGQVESRVWSVEEMEVSPCGEIVLTGHLDRHFGVWQVDAKTGRILGQTERRSSVSRFMLTLHRSLFLDHAGRILAGICAVLSFCLLLAEGRCG